MNDSLYAMDTSFYHSLGSYDFAARCEMLAELGYDGTYLTLWSEVSRQDLKLLGTVPAKHGLSVAAVFDVLDDRSSESSSCLHRVSLVRHRRKALGGATQRSGAIPK